MNDRIQKLEAVILAEVNNCKADIGASHIEVRIRSAQYGANVETTVHYMTDFPKNPQRTGCGKGD